VQRDFDDFYAALFYLLDDFRREMQSGGRCGDGSAIFGENGLITGAILVRLFFVALDIRRKRRFSDRIQNLVKIAVRFKFDDDATFIRFFDDFRR